MALLIELYGLVYSKTKNIEYLHVIESTVAWLESEMMNSRGGFFSAQDADSEGIEGKYYTWGAHEIQEILGKDYTEFADYYHVTQEGNWEHTNILYTTYQKMKATTEDSRLKKEEWHQRLLQVRNKRIKPLTDDKIILGWNALMNKALVSVL